VLPGEEFYEYDTYKTFVWDGYTWREYSKSVQIENVITLKTIPVDLAATDTVVVGVATKIIKVYAVKLIVSADMSINFRDGGATDIEGAMPLLANAGYVESVTPPLYLFRTTAGNDLDLVIGGVGKVTGRISYWDSDTI
jgi:hypothetical protein